MRTEEEILTEMDAVQAKFPVLTDLDSTSSVSFFLNLKKYWVLLVQMLANEWEAFRASVEATIQNTSVGSLSWYVDQIKAFQLGDSVAVINGRVGYDVIDAQKRIVKQCTGTEDIATGRLIFRVAKAGDAGFVSLSLDELEAVKGYVARIKYAGVVADVNSMEADHLKLVATVKVDRQVLKLDGSLLTDATKFPIQAAISAYIASLPFDSILNNTDLTDQVQKVKGVKDFTITGTSTRRPAAATWTAYNREVVSAAGHMILHNDSQITYQY